MQTPDPPHQDPSATPSQPSPSKIRHSEPLNRNAPARPVSLDPEPVPVVEATGPSTVASKITAFGREKKHEEEWDRTPNTTGTGAIHVKTFHAKLTEDALLYMDQCINEWLDAHPQYEVKFVTTSVGILTGKLKEPNLFCQVWV